MVWCDVGRGALSSRLFGPVDGAPVLLIAGGGGAMSTWVRLLPEVASTMSIAAQRFAPIEPSLAADMRVAVFDQAGVGESIDVAPAVTAAEAAADALAVGQALLGERFAVVGISLGGVGAIKLALEHPDVVSALVLASTFPSVSDFVAPEQRPYHQSLEPAAAEVARSFSPSFSTGQPDLFAAICELSESVIVADAMSDAAVGQFISHDGHDLGSITAPATVLCGELDQVFPPGNSRVIASSIPNAHLHLISGAGHGLHMEIPDQLARAIRARGPRAGRPTTPAR